MRAQILSIGSELILGHLTDTNATFLAQQLASLGVELTLVTQVGDDLSRLASVIDRASSEADIVICTGGVGPTADDLTREAIAKVMGETPSVDDQLLETIRAFFRSRGLEMPERNAKQAWLIPSAEPLPNPVGTAPGWFVRRDGRAIVAMPGVPREMFRMWSEQVVTRLATMLPRRAIRSVTIKTIGIGESAAEQLLHDLVVLETPVVATYAKDDGVHVRVTASAPTEEEATRRRDVAAAEVTRRLAGHIYATDDETLPQAVASALRRAQLRIVVADSGGGGRFASLLAGDPDAAERLQSGTLYPASTEAQAPVLASHAIPADRDGLLGLGIAVKLESRGNGVYEGTIEVAMAGTVTAEESMPMRSSFEDAQRRSALFAADVLLRTLRSRSA